MNNLLLLWTKRNLIILGKILIIKSLIVPIFTYVASVPEKYRKEIDSKCFKFIWNNKPDKVKRNTVVGKLGNRGLKMIDIQSYFMSLKESWVSRLVSNQLVNWKVIPCKYFAKLGKKWLVFSQILNNIIVNKYAKQIPEFYGELLRSWNKIGGGQTRTPLNFADVSKQIIWGNKLIKVDHKTLLFNNWINSDLIYVNDILDENAEISHNFILNRLNNKTNWITEFTILKKAISKEWVDIIKTENSPKSVVNICKNYVLIKRNPYRFSILKNTNLYELLLNEKFIKPMVLIHGIPIYKKNLPKCETVCYFIFNY